LLSVRCCCAVALVCCVALAIGVALGLATRSRKSDDNAVAVDTRATAKPPAVARPLAQQLIDDGPWLFRERAISPRSHGAGSTCPPGFTQASELIDKWMRAVMQRDTCVRRHYYPRTVDGSLLDTLEDVCQAPYAYACGSWVKHFANDAVALTERSTDIYDREMAALAARTLADSESVLFRFATTACRFTPLQPIYPARDHISEWSRAEQSASLPVFLHAEGTSIVCALHALFLPRANALTPAFLERVLATTSSQATSALTKLARIASVFACNTTSLMFGALGDPRIVRIEWPPERVPMSHEEFYARVNRIVPNGYTTLWTVASAVAPFTWLASGTDGVRMRVALPSVPGVALLDRTHCARIATVTLVEALFDRFSAQIEDDDTLETLSRCAAADIGTVVLDTTDTAARGAAAACIANAGTAHWSTMPLAAAVCQRARRRRPTERPVLEAHLPAVVRTSDPRLVVVTAALLQSPWYSHQMHPLAVAARLWWTIVRAALVPAACDRATDARALGIVERCLDATATPIDRQFWIELLQLQCSTEATSTVFTSVDSMTRAMAPTQCETRAPASRWNGLLVSTTSFVRAFECAAKN